MPDATPRASPAKVPGDYDSDYDALDDTLLNEIVMSLHQQQRLPVGLEDPSPLAGVQSKLALTVLPDGRFALPKPGSGAPTTHILKVPDRAHPRDAWRENEALAISRICGFETAASVVAEIADIACLQVTRYDRALDESGRVVRIHQEDFAQALGLPAALKYERYGAEGRRFDASAIASVLRRTAEPAGARQAFIRATLFDVLIGNADAHAKNHALLYRHRVPVLAPRYDLLPTRLDSGLRDDLPFAIGSANRLHDIVAADLEVFLRHLGITSRAAQQRLLRDAALQLASALGPLLDPLQSAGHKDFADLIAANMRMLLPVLRLPVPDSARSRDVFVIGGGGWAAS